jgi:hypothetical protein
MAAPILRITPTAASTLAGYHRARGTRHPIGASIVAIPSVPHVNATSSADAPCDTIHATTNVM